MIDGVLTYSIDGVRCVFGLVNTYASNDTKHVLLLHSQKKSSKKTDGIANSSIISSNTSIDGDKYRTT